MDDFEQKLKEIADKIVKEATSNDSLQNIGNEAAYLIKKRTRLGYGVSEQYGNKVKLKPLSKKYIKQRKNDDLSNATTPNKSNLTKTGEMLDSMNAKVKGDGVVNIGVDDNNLDKAGWVSKDRPFNNLSDAEIKQLENKIRDNLINKIKGML